MKNILIDMEIHPEKLAYLKSLPQIGKVDLVDYAEEARVFPKELLEDKHYCLCLTPPANFSDMTSLEFLQISSAGFEQLYGLHLPEKGIRAANGQGVSDVAIAEWCIAMMIALVRNLRELIRHQDARIWEWSHKYQKEIRDSVVGIWGYGSIGREAARLAKAHGMKVFALDRRFAKRSETAEFYSVPGTGDPEAQLPDAYFYPGQEIEFLENLDYLILTIPLTPKTRGMVGEKELRALPRTAFLLNPARGPLIVEDALLKALREGWIAGAALDTHFYYPMPPDHPLWGFPNVIFTPHIAGSSVNERIWDIFIQNVERLLAGRPLLNELTREKLEGR